LAFQWSSSAATPDKRNDSLKEEGMSLFDRISAEEEPHLPSLISKANFFNLVKEPIRALETVKLVQRIDEERSKHPYNALLWRCIDAERAGRTDELRVLAEEVWRENERLAATGLPPHPLGEPGRLKILMLKASAHEQLGNWTEAAEAYNELQGMEVSQIEVLQIHMGVARCSYELGFYDHAMKVAEHNIGEGRWQPGAHKIKALIHKQRGEWEEAVRTMNRALLYEAPWNEKNRTENFELYNELLSASQKA
jgi:tetratricopeptide (TPR) repeat protein